ncbi:dynein regulatory complex protein 9 isoform X2 [Esox lucius]|uniref:Dynein regulatory complex protein 9 n=1 Tax=Esox lucius TaxID=8010 RepID=A0A3P8ZM44_ESOLU|nr:dynein regulatory complex protein 9 isoform X2 [Esox lucius]
MSLPIFGVELLRVCTVLQDLADQLSVLGHIMPDIYRRCPEAAMMLSADIGQVFEQQKGAEQNLKAARQYQVEAREIQDATRELHSSQKELNRALDENSVSPEILAKVQKDRQFVAKVITNVLTELQEKGTYNSLLLAVEEEKKRKANLQDIIIREEEGRQRTKALQRQLLDIRKEKALQLQRRKEMIAYLKDQLQDMKTKTAREKKYVKNSTELLVYQGQKLNRYSEKQLEDEINSLGEKLEVWMERYERDMEDKQQELNNLQHNKANNLSQLQELAKKYRDSELVVIEDRMEKEAIHRQLEKEQTEQDAATKIQSWWRGTLVRCGLGPFKKGKKPKAGKKGKKKK